MQLSDCHILIVDDVNALRVQIRELLKTFGFQKITLCGNGVEARKVLEEAGSVHLLISDWHMAPMDGLELLKFVRTHDHYAQLPFVMMTAEGTKERVIEAIEHGVDDYLMKPMTVQQVQDKILTLLVKKVLNG